jgi:hypothetical protein
MRLRIPGRRSLGIALGIALPGSWHPAAASFIPLPPAVRLPSPTSTLFTPRGCAPVSVGHPHDDHSAVISTRHPS